MKLQRILIGDNLRLERKSGEVRFICSCGLDMGSGQVNFKEHCRLKESSTSSIGPGYASFDKDMENQMCLREFFCPSCGIRHTTEVARVGDPYLWDFQLKL